MRPRLNALSCSARVCQSALAEPACSRFAVGLGSVGHVGWQALPTDAEPSFRAGVRSALAVEPVCAGDA